MILTINVVPFLILLAYFSSVACRRAAAEQPLAFNHQAMVKLGTNCLFCHTDAPRSLAAGMPSEQKCMGCHVVIASNNPEIQKLIGYWQRLESIEWVRINALPRFVDFSHQAHITAGFNCEPEKIEVIIFSQPSGSMSKTIGANLKPSTSSQVNWKEKQHGYSDQRES